MVRGVTPGRPSRARTPNSHWLQLLTLAVQDFAQCNSGSSRTPADAAPPIVHIRFTSMSRTPCCEHGRLEHTQDQAAPVTPVEISRKGVDRLLSGHPWIFRSDVTSTGDAGPGEVVHVLDPRGRFLGQAHYSTSSQIALRMLSKSPEPVD